MFLNVVILFSAFDLFVSRVCVEMHMGHCVYAVGSIDGLFDDVD